MMKNIGNNKKKIVAIVVCVAIVATIGTATAFAVNASKATGFVSDVNGTRTFNDDSATAGLDKSGAINGGNFVIEDDTSVAVETIQVGESTESEADAILGGNFTFDEGTLNISFDQK